MAKEVKMNIPAVRGMSKKFGDISDVLEGVNRTLEMVSNTLKASAFIGLVGNAAMALMIDRIRPFVKQMADKCGELSKDLSTAVDAFERGDEVGATRFY